MNRGKERVADIVRVHFEVLDQEFRRILVKNGFEKEKAKTCAHIYRSKERR